MHTNNTTMYFGITGGIAALTIGHIAIGIQLEYLPSAIAVMLVIILFARKIDSLKIKKRSLLNSIFFGVFIALSTLFLSALAGSIIMFVMSLLDFAFPNIDLSMNTFDSSDISFIKYISSEGMQYLLPPFIFTMSGGFIPALILGLFYGILRNRQQC